MISRNTPYPVSHKERLNHVGTAILLALTVEWQNKETPIDAKSYYVFDKIGRKIML